MRRVDFEFDAVAAVSAEVLLAVRFFVSRYMLLLCFEELLLESCCNVVSWTASVACAHLARAGRLLMLLRRRRSYLYMRRSCCAADGQSRVKSYAG